MESYSNHPIARSIVLAYQGEIDQNLINDYKEISGNGICVIMDDEEYYLGNQKLMKSINISLENVNEIGTLVYISKKQELLGYLVISDEIKETSANAITSLKDVGVKMTVMLSGDNKQVASIVADQVGIDEVYAELLPADKVDKVEELLVRTNKKLAFVGDGINDAPVLARADIGVAMGGIGSDAAIEAADLVLMKDDPMALVDAIQISKRTNVILKQNIIFSLAIKAIVLVLSALGLANMWMGVFADVGVTLIAIFNSMRLLRVK